MEYKSVISPKMKAVEELLFDRFVGMDHCMTDDRRNLIVEVPRGMCDSVRAALKTAFDDVALMRNAYQMIEDLHDFILVKPMVSESPVFWEADIPVPELEKRLVDYDSDKEYAFLTDAEIQDEFQRAFELYPVNTSRLYRYAGRKGKKEEIQHRIHRLNTERVDIVKKVQEYMIHKPVERAWLFGSFARHEERPDSDIDILVGLDKSQQIGLLYFAGMINDLELLLGRKVDLVEEGSVKPFAVDSINRDKILVYERA